MAVAFRLADLGEGISEAEIVEWLVDEGDTVAEHQLLVRVETDKALVEVPSPAAGRMGRIRHQAGDTVHVGDVLAWILQGEEGEDDLAQAGQTPVAAADRSASVVGALDQPMVELPPRAAGEILATPAVRRLARALGVRLDEVRGTGHEGRITEADVREYAAREGAPTGAGTEPEDAYGPVDRVPLRGIRRTIARRLKAAVAHAALATHMDEIDVSELLEHTRARGDHAGFFAWVVKAVALTLRAQPRFNATLDEAHEEVLLRRYVNIGIAADTADGLMVPVIHRVETKSVEEIASEIERLAALCRERKVGVAALRGGTFSISNIGSLGGSFATPIPNHPELAILATGQVRERLARGADGAIVSRFVLPVSLSFDHRVLDGADAARFTNTLGELLAHPERLD